MPYLKVDTTATPGPEQMAATLKRLSVALAETTGKPEKVCQAALQGGVGMIFAGVDGPSAHVEVKGINFDETKAGDIAKAVCAVLEEDLGIPGKRVYLAFTSFRGAMWGVDGKTY
ncbi:MAG: hypothetical protein LUC93_18630 [Planctomycetaceae bacterium]|nr:hypothetical protein [Planctomycetaceae bacterium]